MSSDNEYDREHEAELEREIKLLRAKKKKQRLERQLQREAATDWARLEADFEDAVRAICARQPSASSVNWESAIASARVEGPGLGADGTAYAREEFGFSSRALGDTPSVRLARDAARRLTALAAFKPFPGIAEIFVTAAEDDGCGDLGPLTIYVSRDPARTFLQTSSVKAAREYIGGAYTKKRFAECRGAAFSRCEDAESVPFTMDDLKEAMRLEGITTHEPVGDFVGYNRHVSILFVPVRQ